MANGWKDVEARFARTARGADFASLRLVHTQGERLAVCRGVVQPAAWEEDLGAMVTVVEGKGAGYAATADLTEGGLAAAVERARAWARRAAEMGCIDHAQLPRPEPPRGEYASPCRVPWGRVPLQEKIDLLRRAAGRLKCDERIVDWEASLSYSEAETLLLTSEGGRVLQHFSYVAPMLSAAANRGADTQRRTLGGRGRCRQGGWEIAEEAGMEAAAPRIAEEALALLDAPECPEGKMDLLIDPDQMILQIHESIGHPLELDRILGDERNYAGTSFVNADMFGGYRYGAELLNVVFDPGEAGQLASYAFDDAGTPAEKEYIIQEGILLRGLGGAASQARAGVPGVACARAVGWNRPPIDRMANLNIVPGESAMGEMVAAVERGVYMKTNCSWSIDDSRLKFQFGCEWAQLIEEGRLTQVVKNPSYRGVTPEFWRSLKMVGGAETFEVLGTPNCGKGEPNQMIRVGHASPVCLFGGVEVFGGV